MRPLLASVVALGVLAVPGHAGATRTGGCHDATAFLWPASSRAWAQRIVWRESRGDPRAKNRRSSASGCYQLLKLHAPRFAKLGFSWERDRFDPIVNTWVAMDLFREQGARPWS